MTTKVLIVDDSATVRQQVRLALSQAGFDVVEAVDGMDGLERIQKGSDIRAVICDVNMPRMSGIELLEHCHKQGGPGMPVLMLTTEGQPALIQKAKQYGAKGWIVKPFKAELLVAAVKKLTQAA
jgi:two-component system chemotaxis response regulator CheY